jgi:hypothetical protein
MWYKGEYESVGENMKLRSGIISFVMVIVLGCAASTPELQRLTSSKTGCSENATKISNSQAGMKTASWTADCEGKTYYCAGDDMLRGVSCSEKK